MICDHETCGAPATQQDRALAVFSLSMKKNFVGLSCCKQFVADLSGISALAMTSEIAIRPPSRKHRKHSRNTCEPACKEICTTIKQGTNDSVHSRSCSPVTCPDSS